MLESADWRFRGERLEQIHSADVPESLRKKGELVRRMEIIDADG